MNSSSLFLHLDAVSFQRFFFFFIYLKPSNTNIEDLCRIRSYKYNVLYNLFSQLSTKIIYLNFEDVVLELWHVLAVEDVGDVGLIGDGIVLDDL